MISALKKYIGMRKTLEQPSFVGDRIDVLDHGYVILANYMGSDEAVVRSARVSYAGDGKTGVDKERDQKLISYLHKNRHTSPFESVQFTFEVKAPIFVFRQWHRHRTWSYNEISARYSQLPAEFYVPEIEDIGVQSKDNKQVRDKADNANAEMIQGIIQQSSEEAFKVYEDLISHGAPRELARSVLPVNTYSKMFATVDLHNLFHFLRLRMHSHAQYEIRVYAEAMLELIKPVVPYCAELIEKEIKIPYATDCKITSSGSGGTSARNN